MLVRIQSSVYGKSVPIPADALTEESWAELVTHLHGKAQRERGRDDA